MTICFKKGERRFHCSLRLHFDFFFLFRVSAYSQRRLARLRRLAFPFLLGLIPLFPSDSYMPWGHEGIERSFCGIFFFLSGFYLHFLLSTGLLDVIYFCYTPFPSGSGLCISFVLSLCFAAQALLFFFFFTYLSCHGIQLGVFGLSGWNSICGSHQGHRKEKRIAYITRHA